MKKNTVKTDIPHELLRSCKAVVYDRVVSKFCGEARLEEGCWTGKFVAVARLTISERVCFLVRLDGERYTQIYLEYKDPHILKTKWYVVEQDGAVDPDTVFSTKSAASAKCSSEQSVVKGADIVEAPDKFIIPVIFM